MKVIYSPKKDSLLFKVANQKEGLKSASKKINVMWKQFEENYSSRPKLTLGEQYDVVEVSFDNDLYRLTDDSNNMWCCLKTNFITLEVHREQIINDILK
jgi:hypothetical protein